jgi:hypothetical protein
MQVGLGQDDNLPAILFLKDSLQEIEGYMQLGFRRVANKHAART